MTSELVKWTKLTVVVVAAAVAAQLYTCPFSTFSFLPSLSCCGQFSISVITGIVVRVVLSEVQSRVVMSHCIQHGSALCSVTLLAFQWLASAWVECLPFCGAFWSCRAGWICTWKPALCLTSARICQRCCSPYPSLCWMMSTRRLLSVWTTKVPLTLFRAVSAHSSWYG